MIIQGFLNFTSHLIGITSGKLLIFIYFLNLSNWMQRCNWHYPLSACVSFGLTDLHGDGRVHALEEPSGPDFPSGFGFELTFRLIKPTRNGADDITTPASPPPTWPAALLQALAKYVFHTGNSFFSGDHVSWHCPLDGSNVDSRLQHMLLAEDLLLPPVPGPLG